jgi:hypothetical protein
MRKDEMPNLVAFASLPFGLLGGIYDVRPSLGSVRIHVTDLGFNPFLTVAPRPELARALPEHGIGEGFTSYTWYDHPFVLRTVFGHNVASLGSINSTATIVQFIPPWEAAPESALAGKRDEFAAIALGALNNLVAAVRQQARLYHVFDLERSDIDLTVRDDQGNILEEDPLGDDLIRSEEARSEVFDLLAQDDAWYGRLRDILSRAEPVGLADDLLIEAERALGQRFPRQAIASAYTALEAGVSSMLTARMSQSGQPDAEIDYLLSTKSLIYKLDAMLRRYYSFSLKHDHRNLWDRFGHLTEMRNDIVHRGRQPQPGDAEYAIAAAGDILAWLAFVRDRKRT